MRLRNFMIDNQRFIRLIAAVEHVGGAICASAEPGQFYGCSDLFLSVVEFTHFNQYFRTIPTALPATTDRGR